MLTHYVLIDYENIQPESLAPFHASHFRVFVMVGAHQSKVSFEVALALQELGDRGTYLKVSGSGHNALDLHIAYYIGQLSANDPQSQFTIISKDTGFDPLIQHLRSKQVKIQRRGTPATVPQPSKPSKPALSERTARVIMLLRNSPKNRPGKMTALSNWVAGLHQKKLTTREVEGLISELQQRGLIIVDGAKVTYTLAGVTSGGVIRPEFL